MRLKTLWDTLTLDEREDLATRSGLQMGYLRLLGGGHKTGCSIATVLALIRVEKRLTADELVEEFSDPARDGRLGPKKTRARVAAAAPAFDLPALTDDEAIASVAKLRQSGQARLQYADALEAWNAARPAYAEKVESSEPSVNG